MTKILHNRIRWLLAALMLLLTSGGISAATETATRLYDSTLLTKTVRTVDGVQYTHLSWLGLDATRMPAPPRCRWNTSASWFRSTPTTSALR